MHFNELTSIINLILLGVHIFVQLVAAILIYIKHHSPQNRAWRYIFVFFMIEILRPQWLNIKRLLFIFLPSILCAAVVLLFVVKGDITMLNSVDDLRSHMAEPNVIARLMF